MLDPFGPAPGWLHDLVHPWALYFNLPAASEHIHEILFSFIGYQLIHFVISPWLSPRLFPRHYQGLNRRTKLNWDVHVVSLVQSTTINAAALWVMFTDAERKDMSIGERVHGYTGSCGLISALATGYFIYDLIISTIYIRIFGVGMLFHAISALWVFSFGFRPFVNFYSPVFILYELSSPFLNIHWFCDKVGMTGSKLQWYNGMMLLFVFFSCRLVWGTWQSALVYRDMWYALKQTWSGTAALDPATVSTQIFQLRDGAMCLDEACVRAGAEVSRFKAFTADGVPTWLVGTYVVSNLVLNGLNYYWFSKMVETVLKRFRTPAGSSDEKNKKKSVDGGSVEDLAQKVVLDAAKKLEEEEGALFHGDEVATVVDTVAEDLRKRKSTRATSS
ncbi:hypothetical protein FE257_012826 [Aspergillus nanangensis]|uniref:TLC domain-containing protein n=1 Tax=Aspergillus nanangensis TaxID=2582783 RepID=A0AAD4CFJ3_ASPNN|nr:hypothetical protein FE257_012826 [Aspergillus nanangensis]